MRCSGQGDVFLAERAFDVHLLNLNNAGLSISGKNVLAFSAGLNWNIERVRGASVVTGGLFNTTLRGTGWVALTTDGPPVVLNAAEAPTFADTNSVVAWSSNLQTQLKTSFKAGALIGRGSGRPFRSRSRGAASSSCNRPRAYLSSRRADASAVSQHYRKLTSATHQRRDQCLPHHPGRPRQKRSQL